MSRPSCLVCARKHISQASVLMDEAMLGYPEHAWLAVGHMAEAESELLSKYSEMAEVIRSHRLKYVASIVDGTESYSVPIISLIEQITELDTCEDIEIEIGLPDDDEKVWHQ